MLILRRAQELVRRWGALRAPRVMLGLASDKAWALVRLQLDRLFWRDLEENTRYALLETQGFSVEHTSSGVLVRNGQVTLFCRRFSSDLSVFKQIFADDEFADLLALLRQRHVDVRYIVDAGGNIGAAAVRFRQEFPAARIISIEPDAGNFRVMVRNARLNAVDAELLQRGVWRDLRRLYFDRSFRDRAAWSTTLSEHPISEDYVESVRLADVVDQYALPSIDLLKIDIEGGERILFDGTGRGLEFLDITKAIAIEIHDEFAARDTIVSALSQRGFELGVSGEYVIGLNGNLV
jgi:FkbM family methyltransferase